jgi:transcriptional regulator with PAS, ATPase and Fis domain
MTRLGAHYIGEPVGSHKLREIIRIAARTGQTVEPSEAGRHEPWRKLLIGDSEPMREIVETISLVGSRRSTVLISGETGTGKEVAARAIHAASPRGHLPMVTVNCAALPENLLEAELFGHTRGAFTGAVNARVGLFEQAHRSSIFLDEIGEMPIQLQAKLLRVLQEREIHRIGSSETIRLDVRVIAASNCDLEAAVSQKRFRQDLFYRLNVVPMRMPALRERISDVPELVEHFIRKISELESTAEKIVSAEAMEYLMTYRWPGNIRQLEHAVESAMALSASRRVLHPRDFRLPAAQIISEIGLLGDLDVPESGIDMVQLMDSIERKLLERALHRSGGNKARAADLLNMKRTTLVSKFKALESCA